MKHYFLDLRTKSQLNKNKSIRESKAYADSKIVGILFTVEDKKKHEGIKDLMHRLEKDGKKVEVFCFLPEGKDNYEFMFDFLTLKDISKWGEIQSSQAQKFCNTAFDYLYYIDTEPNPILMNLIARSKALCRIGRHWDNGHPFFELMIESPNDTKSLIESIYRYSIQIK
jgi:hypothetical protein